MVVESDTTEHAHILKAKLQEKTNIRWGHIEVRKKKKYSAFKAWPYL